MLKYTTLCLTTALVGIGLSASPSFAHHGSNGQFDTSKTLEVTGVVTDIKFVNPHGYVYFDVTNDAGGVDAWRCELRAGSLLKRRGWSEALFPKGEKITINGSPAWTEEFGCMTQLITFPDGRQVERNGTIEAETEVTKAPRILVLADGTPNIAGTWIALREERGGRPGGGAGGEGGAMGGGAMGGGGMGAPGEGGGPPPGEAGRSNFQLTDAGAKASEGYQRDDMPRLNCTATNIFEDFRFDQHVNQIIQGEDEIVIKYGFMDIVRTIDMTADKHPDGIKLSRAGHSIGTWEGDTLVVDTKGFEPGYLTAPPFAGGGVVHSDKLHVVERFTMSADGQTLSRKYSGDDADHLKEPFSGEDSVIWTDAAFDPYNCDDLTNEVTADGRPANGGGGAQPYNASGDATLGANDASLGTIEKTGGLNWLLMLIGAALAFFVLALVLKKRKSN